MAGRRHLTDAVEDQRGRGRLAGTGRSQQREMLAEHRIDIERGADILGRIDRADLHVGAVVGGVDLLEVGGGHREDVGARGRITRHAAAEIIELAGQLLLVAFAEEIDLRRDPVAALISEFQRADIGDQPGIADPHLDLAADRAGARRRPDRYRRRGHLQRGEIEDDLARRAGDFEHRANRGTVAPSGASCPCRRGVSRIECLAAQHFGHSFSPRYQPADYVDDR